jgi:hypothetical protein
MLQYRTEITDAGMPMPAIGLDADAQLCKKHIELFKRLM